MLDIIITNRNTEEYFKYRKKYAFTFFLNVYLYISLGHCQKPMESMLIN